MTEEPRNIQLSELTELAEQLAELDTSIATKEEEVSTLKQQRKTIAEEHLPQLMEQAGVNTLELSDGRKIAIQEFVDARIKDPNTAFDWLRETNNESIIKNQITLSLGRNEDALAQEIMNKIQREYGDVQVDNRISIHNMTLKSFCKEALDNPELAETLPKQAFGIYEGKRAKVTQ
jgi:hypothetical protein